MKTYKRKSIPISAYDLPAFESWLEDLAQEGLFLVSLNGYGGKFRQGEPKKMTYRVEIPKYFDRKPPKKMEEMYQEFGWEFICTYYQNGFIFASEAENPVELHTDPITQSEGVRDFYREQRNEVIICIILLLLASVAVLALKWTNLAKAITEGLHLQSLIFWGYSIFGVFYSVKELLSLRKLKTNLEMGISLEHRKPYKKYSFLKNIFLCYAAVLLLSNAVDIALLYTHQQEDPLTITEINLPFVSLEELGDTGEGQTIYRRSTLLAPVQYEIYESGQNTSLYGYYMEVRPAFLAEQTMQSIADDGRFEGLSGFRFFITGVPLLQPIPLDIPAEWFDGLLYYEDEKEGETYFTAYKGNKVIAVKYTGTIDLTAHLDKFSALLKKDYDNPQLLH